MRSSLQPLLLAVSSLLLVSQCGASVPSLINAVDEMEKNTKSILDPEAWKSQKEVLSRFGNTQSSAADKAMKKAIVDLTGSVAAMQRKVANLKQDISDEMERRMTKAMAAMEEKQTKAMAAMEEKHVSLTKAMAAMEEKHTKAMAAMEEKHVSLTKAMAAMEEKQTKAMAAMEEKQTKAMAAMDAKIVRLTKAEIAEENERRLLPTDWCPRPWKRVRSDLCISVSYEEADWAAAEGLCRFFNATLMTFRNMEDYRAVAKEGVLYYQCPWVGIKRVDKTEKFYGPKENKFVYNLRKAGDDNACAIACWGHMTYGDCSFKRNFVCLKKRV